MQPLLIVGVSNCMEVLCGITILCMVNISWQGYVEEAGTTELRLRYIVCSLIIHELQLSSVSSISYTDFYVEIFYTIKAYCLKF